MMSSVLAALAGALGLRRDPTSAAEWMALSQSGRMTPRQRRALAMWLEADPAHAREYARCRQLNELAAQLQAHPQLVQAMPAWRALEPSRRPARAARPLRMVAAAACAVMVVTIGYVLLQRDAGTLITTAHGEQRQLALEDGSVVYLNTDSALRVAFTARTRRVDIERGQAYFEVASNPARPFIVHAGTGEMRVVGTKFDVRRSEGQLAVIVSEGRVRVLPRLPDHTATEDLMLVPGDAVRIDYRSQRLELASIDPERAIAWRKGIIEFDAATLAEVISEVNRYTAKRLVIADEPLRRIRISGRFNVGDIDSVQFALTHGFDIRTEAVGNDILLKQRRP